MAKSHLSSGSKGGETSSSSKVASGSTVLRLSCSSEDKTVAGSISNTADVVHPSFITNPAYPPVVIQKDVHSTLKPMAISAEPNQPNLSQAFRVLNDQAEPFKPTTTLSQTQSNKWGVPSKSLRELKASTLKMNEVPNKNTVVGSQPLSLMDMDMVIKRSMPISLMDMPLWGSTREEDTYIGKEQIIQEEGGEDGEVDVVQPLEKVQKLPFGEHNTEANFDQDEATIEVDQHHHDDVHIVDDFNLKGGGKGKKKKKKKNNTLNTGQHFNGKQHNNKK
ncbi:unnamed protein product [Cuscuta campestris]|uniref:Uncharacterized protein n=1 Tax=Cuscuta campestris TaxID=132261 RepID=A0A484LLD9_9ASTE|nr:unnamed protein product [Cuscuta campestris]